MSESIPVAQVGCNTNQICYQRLGIILVQRFVMHHCRFPYPPTALDIVMHHFLDCQVRANQLANQKTKKNLLNYQFPLEIS